MQGSEEKGDKAWNHFDDWNEDHDLHLTPPHGEEGEGMWLVSYADMMTLIVGFFAILLSFSSVDSKKFERIKKETTLLFGGQYQVPYKDMSADLEQVFQKEGVADQILIEQTADGIALTFQGALFFDSGLSGLKKEANALLTKIAPVIHSRAANSHILIEGHTDDIPIQTSLIPSNWELSSLRACTVLRLFLDHGFSEQNLRAIGLGSTKPIVPNEDELSRSKNRRVVIRITKGAEV